MFGKKDYKYMAKTEEGKKAEELLFKSHWKLTLMILGINVTVIGLLAFLGSLLDSKLNTNHMFSIASLVLAFPLAQVMVYKTTKNITTKKA